MSAFDRLQQLAQHATYEPSRNLEGDPAPEPLRDQVRELPIRVNGARLFVATDEHGELVGVGLMEQGGDRRAVAGQLYAAIDDVPAWMGAALRLV